MLERRPILGLLLVLNVCLLIWRISVQESSALLESESLANGVSIGGNGNGANSNERLNAEQQQQMRLPVPLPLQQQQSRQQIDSVYAAARQHQHQQLYAGKHLLSKRMEANDTAAAEGEAATRRRHKYKVSTSLKEHTKNSISSSSKNSIKHNDKTSGVDPNPRLPHATLKTTAATAVSQASGTPVTPPLPGATSASKVDANATYAPGDAARLIDIVNFRYLQAQPDCHPHTQALILVHSAPNNTAKRALIRDTWASVADSAGATPLRVLFLLGAVPTTAQQQRLEAENARHQDMVQGSFVDNYRNMTYKHVMALKWFLYQCAHAQLLIKVDDDNFVNTPQLLKYLRDAANDSTAHVATATVSVSAHFNASQVLFRSPRNLLFCRAIRGSQVKRSYRSKWRVSGREYAGRYYPTYCPGYAIIYSPDAVQRLYRAAQQHRYFWIDDVHITGVLAQQVNISITDSAPYILQQDMWERLKSGRAELNDFEFLYAWHSIRPEERLTLWRLLNNAEHYSSINSTLSASAYSLYGYEGFR